MESREVRTERRDKLSLFSTLYSKLKYGFLKRSLEFFERAQKMVAFPSHLCFIVARYIIGVWRWKCRGTIYLYFILNGKTKRKLSGDLPRHHVGLDCILVCLQNQNIAHHRFGHWPHWGLCSLSR